MKKLLLITTILMFFISCVEKRKEEQNYNTNTTQNVPIKADENNAKINMTEKKQIDRLKSIYNKYQTTSNKEIQTQLLDSFFILFPDSFSLFINLYGYNEISIDSTSYGQLYDCSYPHVELFFKSKEIIESDIFIKKTINISLNGFWESDAVAIFKKHLIDLLISNKKLFYSILNEYNVKDIKSFWKFYFDEPHPENFDFKQLNDFKQLDSAMYDIIIKSHDNALKNACVGH